MDAALLQVVRGKVPEQSSGPLVVYEWVVDPQTRPYLVLGHKNLRWLERSLPGIEGKTGLIRSVVRDVEGGFDQVYQSVIAHVAHRGIHAEYGSVHPDTVEGVVAAAEYVQYFLRGPVEYPMNPLDSHIEILTSEADTPLEGPSLDVGGKHFPVIRVPWLPPRVSVVVPEDRGFLGDLHLFGGKYYTVVVHNPARGLAISSPKGFYEELALRINRQDESD